MTTATALDQQYNDHNHSVDDGYPDFLASIQQSFENVLNTPDMRVFTTDVDDLYTHFLRALPEPMRQTHNCRACQAFTRKYGGLVSIDSHGNTIPVMWKINTPTVFATAVKRLYRIVRNAQVTGVFLSDNPVWGIPVTGPWSHFAVQPAKTLIYNGRIKSAGQMMAEKLEDYKAMLTALHELPLHAVQTAMPLLLNETLYRSEKVLGVAEWLKNLHEQQRDHRPNRNNILWRAVATAPAGFCHPRSSMIGTLLEDILAGYQFADVKRRFDAKMQPLQYHRPQAPPSAGNIAQAEKIIEQLNAAGSLDRRYATLDDLQTLWRPTQPVETATTGVFGHLASKQKPHAVSRQLTIPTTTMTCVKFMKTILPSAQALEVYLPQKNTNYIALVTALNPDAPPIIQWDREDRRNPVSWYVYANGSPAHQWNLQADSWCQVNAVTLQPSMWYDDDALAHNGEGVIFILDGAKDSMGASAGAALFPEVLKADLHPIRATLESYSRSAKIHGLRESSACGLMFRNQGGWGTVRVTTKDSTNLYQLDRWD